jgi:Family of unknown function (DUF6496)
MATKKKSTASRRKSGDRKYGKAAGKSVESAVRREKKGTLRSGKGGKGGVVKSRKQAIAIGLSEARKKGAKVPEKKSAQLNRIFKSRHFARAIVGHYGLGDVQP